MLDKDLVTIVVPAFNSEDFILECIDSIQNQTFRNWELIVVDDGSTDMTIEKIKSKVDNRKIFLYLRTRKEKGANTCRNIGIQKAKGQYILFLDADDILTPECLESRLDYFRKNPGLDFVSIKMGRISEENKILRMIPPKKYKDPLAEFIALNCIWNISSPLYKTEFLKSINGFNEEYPRLQDVELAFRILRSKATKYTFLNSEPPDSYYRQGANIKDEKFYSRYYPIFSKFIDDVHSWIIDDNLGRRKYMYYLNRTMWNFILAWYRANTSKSIEREMSKIYQYEIELPVDKLFISIVFFLHKHKIHKKGSINHFVLQILRFKKWINFKIIRILT